MKGKKQNNADQIFGFDNIPDNQIQVKFKMDFKKEWKDPANFEAIKDKCRELNIDWKNISDADKSDIINLIKGA